MKVLPLRLVEQLQVTSYKLQVLPLRLVEQPLRREVREAGLAHCTLKISVYLGGVYMYMCQHSLLLREARREKVYI